MPIRLPGPPATFQPSPGLAPAYGKWVSMTLLKCQDEGITSCLNLPGVMLWGEAPSGERSRDAGDPPYNRAGKHSWLKRPFWHKLSLAACDLQINLSFCLNKSCQVDTLSFSPRSAGCYPAPWFISLSYLTRCHMLSLLKIQDIGSNVP